MVPITGWSHETTLTAEPISAALAREFVRLHLVAHHLVHLVEDVRLVVSELATNAVAHAQTPFVVTLASANGSIVLAIQDGSPSAPVRSRPDVTDMSGRGLMIVELLSQAWGTSTDAHGFKSVWASFPMSDPRGPQGAGPAAR
jgi:anti-sigma regulatory factor (Ser/Thr protein kinase)